MICLLLNAPTITDNFALLESHKPWIDLAELRVDCLDEEERQGIISFSESATLPLILTCRRKNDGGFFNGTEEERLRLLVSLVSNNFTYIDIEYDIDCDELEKAVQKNKLRVIRSCHNFDGVPEDLDSFLSKMRRTPEEIIKGSFTTSSSREVFRLWDTARKMVAKNEDFLLIGMGEFGVSTRILAPRLGSLWTYASAKGEVPVVSGQLDPEALDTLYRYHSLSKDTRIAGIIGNPISHSLSPEIHNRRYAEEGKNALYLKFLVDSIPEFLKLAAAIPLCGFSVTIPFKEEIVSFLDEKSESIDKIRACNTVFRKRGKWIGDNTDAEGFMEPLLERIGKDKLNGLKTAVIGAGGAARSVVYALTQAGADVCVYNRTVSKAEILAKEFKCDSKPLDKGRLIPPDVKIIIQTTGVGMHPLGKDDPVPSYKFNGSELIYDLIYSPLETVLLRRAKNAGCEIISGIDMLRSQAERQIKIFLECENQ